MIREFPSIGLAISFVRGKGTADIVVIDHGKVRRYRILKGRIVFSSDVDEIFVTNHGSIISSNTVDHEHTDPVPDPKSPDGEGSRSRINAGSTPIEPGGKKTADRNWNDRENAGQDTSPGGNFSDADANHYAHDSTGMTETVSIGDSIQGLSYGGEVGGPTWGNNLTMDQYEQLITYVQHHDVQMPTENERTYEEYDELGNKVTRVQVTWKEDVLKKDKELAELVGMQINSWDASQSFAKGYDWGAGSDKGDRKNPGWKQTGGGSPPPGLSGKGAGDGTSSNGGYTQPGTIGGNPSYTV